MLKNWVFSGEKPDKDACKARLKQLRQDLAGLQQRLRQAHLPVIILLEGWGAAGKGSAIRSLIRELDPRFFKVLTVDQPTREDRRWPFLKRYFSSIPESGKLLFLDSGWISETAQDYLCGELSELEFSRQLESIRVMERQLTAGGYLLVKLFFHIDDKQQHDRLHQLASHRDTSWRASEADWRQNKNYDKYLDCFDRCLESTDTPWAPWKVIDGSHKALAQMQAAEWLYQQICAALESNPETSMPEYHWPLMSTPLLAQVPLDKTMEDKRYRKELKACKKRLAELHNELYRKKVPVVLVYEGWDAAGKGGNIKRLASALDPRGYEVIPIASPTPEELSRHYLWRFWTRLPKTGHIAIFDRSWYGRVMVERLEGFCSEEDWKRAYDELNEFERELTDTGTVVLKFWVHIDKQTQLERFRDRQQDPAKQWKITEEDWRNREKWDAYEKAVDEMLRKTNTKNAPWYILESVDKRYARIKAMKLVIQAIEQAL